MPRRSLSNILRSQLAQREREHAPVRTVQIIGRERDGTEQQRSISGECILRAGQGGHEIGELTSAPAAAPYQQRGVAGIAPAASLPAGTIWLESQEPHDLRRGTTQSVSFHGVGLVGGMTFVHRLSESEEPHPGVTIDDLAYVDSTRYDATVSVTADAELTAAAPLAFAVGSGTPRVVGDGYGVVAAPTGLVVGELWAFAVSGSFASQTLVAALYLDGAFQQTLGSLSLPLVDPPSGRRAVLLRGDPTVADGSIAWRATFGQLVVWEVATGQLYTHDTAGFWLSAPVYHDGWLYWFETDNDLDRHPYSLFRARGDLQAPQLVGSIDPGGATEGDPPHVVAHFGDAVRTANYEADGETYLSVQIGLDGTAAAAASDPLGGAGGVAAGGSEQTQGAIFLPHGGRAYGVRIADGLGTTLEVLDAGSSQTAQPHWPAVWAHEETLGADLWDGRALVYGRNDGVESLYCASLLAAGEPDATLEPEDVPLYGKPILMFFKPEVP